jgi:Zn-finger nucleic acid-binding protein
MQCPTDGTTLVMSERSGIEIDYCPQCRGVWLDRGELDKIIERSAPQSGASAPRPSEPLHSAGGPGPWSPGGMTHGGYGHGDPGYRERTSRKRKSWIEDIFD